MTDPNDWIAALQRIAELEAAVQHADKVVEQLTAERDAALERAEKAEAAVARAREEVDDMNIAADVDEGHGGECNECAAMALRRYAGHLRAALGG